jgi:ABC-type amino acid transport substrate-binding protein
MARLRGRRGGSVRRRLRRRRLSGESEASAKASVSTITGGELTVGSDIPFPPFEFRKGDELTGFDVELTEELARRMDLRVKWVDTSFDTLFPQVAAGRFDMAAAATTITPEA